MKSIKLLIFALCCLSTVNVFAQNDLTEEDKKELQGRVKIKVEEFQQYLSDIVNTKLSDSQRQSSIKSALALFIGKGEAYSVENEYGEIERRNPVRMQLSNVYNQRKRWLRMTSYLNNQYNNIHKYGTVEMQSADAVRVDNIYKVGSGSYQAVAYFCQRYAAKTKDGMFIYGPEVTSKKVIVHIKAIETPIGTVWDAKLGDVYVTATRLD
ncbi:hypothetical protein KSZ28_13090 [Bacteroides salyersiae]|uniref:hypothetical protein n=1 Tax=Bacteroides salyersiae TaxID=291644 RepID=UPI001C39485D|nr:hypothetical protein [Bacteroides salyersiae]MBV4204643.1 hypothetical protein [Bacteroides salyersiae]MCB6650164.1 hypothetical protein [Bacteroides salyersiae]